MFLHLSTSPPVVHYQPVERTVRRVQFMLLRLAAARVRMLHGGNRGQTGRFHSLRTHPMLLSEGQMFLFVIANDLTSPPAFLRCQWTSHHLLQRGDEFRRAQRTTRMRALADRGHLRFF